MSSIVKIEQLTKTFKSENESLTIMKDLDFEVQEKSKVIITGESGCGKSTLLHIIGGLDLPSSGRVIVGPYTISEMKEESLTEYRSQYLGLIFQFHYLLKDFTALENVFLPSYMVGIEKKVALEKAKELLCDVGLEHRMNHYPSQLSGGERQRAAVARALMNDPQLVLADEPTGNLDPANASLISEILFNVVDKYKKTLILVTHDHNLAKKGDFCYTLDGGKLQLL